MPKTAFDFSKIIAGNDQVLVLAQHIDVGPFVEATFMIRAHAVSLAGASTIIFDVLLDGYDFGDPALSGVLQSRTPGGAPIAQLTFTSTTSAGFYGTLAIPTNYGRLVGLQLTGHVPGGATGGTCTISVDLSLKGGDAESQLPIPNTYLGYAIENAIGAPPRFPTSDNPQRLLPHRAQMTTDIKLR